jgi:hypothetical protein
MKSIKQIIKEVEHLRDECNHPSCDPESEEYTTQCICAQFDWILDDLKAKQAQLSDWLRMIADPKHSDGEGLAQIPQVIPDDYLSDGEMLDLMVNLLESWGFNLEDFRAEFAKAD